MPAPWKDKAKSNKATSPLNKCMNYMCDNRIKFITQRRLGVLKDDYCSNRCIPEWLQTPEPSAVPYNVWKRTGEPV